MSDLVRQILAASMCLLIMFSFGLNANAQEGEDDPKASESESATATEGDEDAAVAAARARYGPNKSTATVGDKEIFLIASKLDPETDPDYPKIASLKDGDIVELTLGQAIKLSTQFDLKFGKTVVKNANFAPDYPGVYSVWLKKSGNGWAVLFNEKPDVWGTMHKDKYDVGSASVDYSKLDQPTKGLKLDVRADENGGSLTIAWGEHQWSAPFTIQQ